MIVSDDWAIKHEYAFQRPGRTQHDPPDVVRRLPLSAGRVLFCGPAGCCRSDPWSVTEADADRPDHLARAEQPVAFTQTEILGAAVHVPCSEPRRRAGERHGHDAGDAEETELLVALEAFVVVTKTEADFDRHGEAESRD